MPPSSPPRTAAEVLKLIARLPPAELHELTAALVAYASVESCAVARTAKDRRLGTFAALLCVELWRQEETWVAAKVRQAKTYADGQADPRKLYAALPLHLTIAGRLEVMLGSDVARLSATGWARLVAETAERTIAALAANLAPLQASAERRKPKPNPTLIREVRERKAKGLTDEQVAEDLHITVAAVRKRKRDAKKRGW